MHVFAGVLVEAILARPLAVEALAAPVLRTAGTVFVAVCVQALPFLVLGVLLSGVIAAFVSPAAPGRVLPRLDGLAVPVPVAGAAGLVLPGCECASVPVARRLIGQSVPEPRRSRSCWPRPRSTRWSWWPPRSRSQASQALVLARLLASLATACVMGWCG